MIRTLLLVSAVSFVLAIGFFAGAFAVAGGPFSIDQAWRFHPENWRVSEVEHRPPTVTKASVDLN
jgi:hypothetical protein